MNTFFYAYAGLAALTALELGLRLRPRSLGEWFGLAICSALWPAVFGSAVYCAIQKYGDRT